MAVPERVVVSATVKSRAEESDGFRLELEIPSFRSKYPTKVSRVPGPVAQLLAPRAEPYSVVLLRENLMKDKSGDLPWHYYWGLEGIATPAETAAKAQEPDPLEGRDHRIMRSTALAQAVAYLGITGGGNFDVARLLGVAADLYTWLRDGPQDAPDEPLGPAGPGETARPQEKGARPPAASPAAAAKGWVAAPRAATRGSPAERSHAIPAGPPANRGQLFQWGLTYFRLNQKQVLDALGVSTVEQVSDLGEAWEQVKAVYGPAETETLAEEQQP